MSKPNRNTILLPSDDFFPAVKQRKVVPHEIVLDTIASLSPVTHPMFGCVAVYVDDKIVFILRDKHDKSANNGVWLRQRLEAMFDEIIRRECKVEIQRLKKTDSDVPIDLFVHYLSTAYFSVLTWWLGRRSRLTPPQINEIFHSLLLPTVKAVLA